MLISDVVVLLNLDVPIPQSFGHDFIQVVAVGGQHPGLAAEAIKSFQQPAFLELSNDVGRPRSQQRRSEAITPQLAPYACLVHAGQQPLALRDAYKVEMIEADAMAKYV